MECCTGRFFLGLGLEVVPTSHLSELSHIVSAECHGWVATFWQQFYMMEGEYQFFGEQSTVFETDTQRKSIRELGREIKLIVDMVGEARGIIAIDGFPEELILKLSFREKQDLSQEGSGKIQFKQQKQHVQRHWGIHSFVQPTNLHKITFKVPESIPNAGNAAIQKIDKFFTLITLYSSEGR